MVEKPFLLSEIVDILTKLCVDVLPHVMLSKGVQTAHLWRLGDQATEAHTQVLLQQVVVQLLKREDVPLISWEELHVVLKHGNGNVPKVEAFAQKLQNLRLYSHLRHFQSDDLFKHSAGELGLTLAQNVSELDHVHQQLLEVSRQNNVVLSLKDLGPELPKDLHEDSIGDQLVTVFWVEPNDFTQQPQHVLKFEFLVFFEVALEEP